MAKSIYSAFVTPESTIAGTDVTDLTDSGDTTLHYHAADRARANHTGTQTASTISDFDTEVSNNASVVANTAKVTYPSADSTKVGYLTVTGAVDLDTLNSYVDQDITSGASPTLDVTNFTGSCTLTTLTATTVNSTTFDTNVAAAGVTLAGTTLAADGTDTHIDITITPKGNAGIVIPNAAGAPADTTNKLYQTGGVVYFDGNSLEGGGASASDTAYTRAGWNGDTTDAATKNALSDAFYNMVRWQDADTGGTSCTFIGDTGNTTNSGDYNVFGGRLTGRVHTSGNSCGGYGYACLYNSLDGSRNFGYGYQTLYSMATTGEDNIGMGFNTLFLLNHANADKNCAFGNYSGDAMTSGSANCLFGYDSGGAITTGYSNTLAGTRSGDVITTGYQNVGVGSDVLDNISNGYRNTGVGTFALVGANYDNCTGLGYYTTVTGDNQVQLGNSSTTTYVYGSVQDRSDIRDKADIRDTILGLDFINSLRAVDFRWDYREDYREELPDNITSDERKEIHERNRLHNIKKTGDKKRGRYHHGFIAQEVKQVMKDMGIDFGGYQDHNINDGEDVLSLGYTEFIAPMIRAIQELSDRIFKLENI